MSHSDQQRKMFYFCSVDASGAGSESTSEVGDLINAG